MALHIKDFGSFGNRLAAYADKNGYVPEAGDRAREFNFGKRLNKKDWEDLVERAIAATQKAEAALATWREQQ